MYQVNTLKHPRLFDTARKRYFLTLLRPLIYTALGLLLLAIWLNSESSSGFRSGLKESLLEKLVYSNPPPVDAKVDVMYVLGGSEPSLEFKYKTAATLFKKGISHKIWIMSRPGKTEYNQALGRNFTNDEWSLTQLKRMGVPEKNVEAVKINEGFAGTFSEAKDISALFQDRKYRSIVLITSPEHTYRTKLSFDNFLKTQNDKIYVQSSDEKVLLRALVVEYIKLKIYQLFLL